MKTNILFIILMIVYIHGTQINSGILNLHDVKPHQLIIQNVKFDDQFDEPPQIVLSIQQINADKIEVYTRATNINNQGFDLQIISVAQLDNLKINYLAIIDQQLTIKCDNFQTKKELIKIPISSEHTKIAAFITGLSIKQNESVTLQLQSITNNQITFSTKQQALGLCLILGDDKTIISQEQITSSQIDKSIQINVENIENQIKIPIDNQTISFDDIVNKLAQESTIEEEYLEIDSIQIEKLDEDIQSLEIEFLRNDPIPQQLIKTEETHFEKVESVIAKAVEEEIQQEQIEEKKFLAQLNQEDDSIMHSDESMDIDDMYLLVPQTPDELDMDALYKEFTLGDALDDDLVNYNDVKITKQTNDVQQLVNIESNKVNEVQSQVIESPVENVEKEVEKVEKIEDIKIEKVDEQKEVKQVYEQKEVNQVDEQKEIKQVDEQKEVKQVEQKLLIDVPLFDEDLNYNEIDKELETEKKEDNTQQNSPTQYIIDVYNTFIDEEKDKLNQQYDQEHPFVEVQPEEKTEETNDEVPEEMVDDLYGLKDTLQGIDFSLFFDDFKQESQEEVIQEEPVTQKVQMKYQEPKEFKQPKEDIDDVMNDLRIQTISSSEDEKELIQQLKQKSNELKKKLKEQYDSVPQLEEAKKQTEISIHSIENQYPKIESDSKIEYEVESKYTEWSMNQNDKIKQIGLELTDDDYRNPRFSLLQMDKKSEMEIQKQIDEFLGFDDASFVMVKQNLRRR